MDERTACALLKTRFEAAGFVIEENRPFDEAGVSFEIDGYDPARRVGYEYVTNEAGDGWDVDASVVEALAEHRRRGALFVLVVDEAECPDAESLATKADAFLAEIPRPPTQEVSAKKKPTAKKPAAKKPAAKKPAAKKKPAKR